MRIRMKRVYDEPERGDGARVLVDRLWPRGLSKEDADIDLWLKDATPSAALRTWYHADPENRYTTFKSRYRTELARNKKAIQAMLPKRKVITLLTATKDIDRSHVPVLLAFLRKL